MSITADSTAKAKKNFFAPKNDSVSQLKNKVDTATVSADRLLLADTSSSPIFVLRTRAAENNSVVLFGTHEAQPIHRGPISRPELSPDWLFPVMLLIVVVFAWMRLFYSRYFNQMIAALFNNNLTGQIVRDENILVQRATVYLTLLFYLIASLFLYELSFRLDWNISFAGNGFPRFLFFTILVSFVYALKFLILKCCGWLFDHDREFSSYLFNIFIINNALGMLLFPLIIILAFNRTINPVWLFNGSLVLISLGYVYRLARGILIGLRSPGVRLQYLFLYLCALELAPLLLLLRISNAL